MPPDKSWGKDAKPVHVQAVIAGYGTPAAQRTVSLVVNGKTTATKTVAVPANGRATVDFPALEVPYGFSRCEVKIDAADGFPADDLRRFAVQRSDPQKALLIHNYGDNRSPLYVGAALSAAAQSAFILESINVNEAADRKPSNYAFIVLSDLNSLPSLLENSLTEYVRSGGSLLIAAGTSAGSRSQIPIFGAHIVETRDYSRVPDRFMAVGSSDSSYPAVAKAGGWTGVKFFYALDVDPGDARVIVRLGDQTPLLLEKRIGEGRVVLLTSGLDNLTNDFPLHPAFVPFIEQTARYLAGSERQGGARPVDAYLELRNAKEQAQGVEVTDPEGKRPLTLGEAASAQSFQLTEAGYYQLRLANGRQDEVGVNPDPKESNLDVIPDDVLALWQGNSGQSSQEASAATGPATPTRRRKLSGGMSCCWCSLPPSPNRSWPAATSAPSARKNRNLPSPSSRAQRGICCSLRFRGQILPCRVHRFDQGHFLFPTPPFDFFLASNHRPRVVEGLEKHKPVNAVPLGEALSLTEPMFVHPPRQIVRHAGV